MQLAQITTNSLIKRQRDLLQYSFPESTWQKGIAGTVAGTSLPATFSSTELRLNHWTDDEVEVLDNDANRIKTFSDDYKFPLPVLNIPTLGFFQVRTITNNQTCIIDQLSPAYQKAINRWKGLEYDDVTIVAGTDLEWSLGGFELEISTAYEILLSDIFLQEVYPSDIDDLDASYKRAIEAKAMELIYESWIKNPGDVWDRKREMKSLEYDEQMRMVNTYLEQSVACKTWARK